MINLPPQPTLTDLQKYVHEVCIANGWDKSSHLETWLLFTEEIGELAKSIRNHDKLYQEHPIEDVHQNMKEEFADVLSYLLHLANQFDVDLEEAFRKKEAKNAQRNWK